MATNSLLPQNDDLVIDNLKEKVGRSSFNLSHSTTFPIDVDGAILPICTFETVPSDSFEISCECLLRQLSPLKVPLMTTIRLNTAWYWCDNRLAWKKWDRFIEGGRSGNEIFDIPRVANTISLKTSNPKKYSLVDKGQTTAGTNYKNINYKNNLHTYFGISMNYKFDSLPAYEDFIDNSDELPIAFPFFDYQLICRDFYTNIDRLPQEPSSNYEEFSDYDNLNSDWAYSNLFPPDDDEIKLNDGIQISSGFQSGDDLINTTHGMILDKVRYHNVRDDYFTSQKSAPMRGTPPTIGIANPTLSSSVDFSKAFESGATGSTYLSSPLGITIHDGAVKLSTAKGPTDPGSLNLQNGIVTDITSNNAVMNVGANPVSGASVTNNKEVTDELVKQLNKIDITTTGTIATTITSQELRLLSQLTVWQELNQLHDPTYRDFLNAHFSNIQVGESSIEKPQYIGGTSQIININEILQTSASTDSSKLGQQGATAHSLANNYVGKFFCNSYGWVIGVAFIVVDMLYNPAMPRSFSRRTKEDYYFPEFANLSMQATLNKELFFSNDKDWNNTPLGYTGAYDEMRSIPNHVAGDLLNDSYTDLKAWVLRREFSNDNKPALNSTFLSEKGNIDKTAWQVNSMPAFMLQCANYIKAVRPMPYVAIPKAL